MHFCGLVFVDQPTDEAVDEAMLPYGHDEMEELNEDCYWDMYELEVTDDRAAEIAAVLTA
jgi:hypothetical protein